MCHNDDHSNACREACDDESTLNLPTGHQLIGCFESSSASNQQMGLINQLGDCTATEQSQEALLSGKKLSIHISKMEDKEEAKQKKQTKNKERGIIETA